MSIVIVTKDKYSKDREISRAQELQIDKEGIFAKWRMKSDVSKPSLVLKGLGLVFLPLVLAWSILFFLTGIALSLALACFKILGKILPNRKTKVGLQ